MGTFTEKQIAQFMRLVDYWVQGTQKIDRRLFAPDVIKTAKYWGLLVRRDDGRYHTSSAADYGVYFNPAEDLPSEILWRYIKPMAEQHSGFSINKNPAWLKLNIYPADHKADSNEMRRTREMALLRMDMAGYIYFQAAGNMWRIDIRE